MSLALTLALGLFSEVRLSADELITVGNQVAGPVPEALGYNLGHFMPDSNAADWFRYSRANAARVFISVADIEPQDDLAPVGDGVGSEAQFFARRAALRSNAASRVAALDPALVNWEVFLAAYEQTSSGNNRQQLKYALSWMREQGVSVLANLTASPTRFPITAETDWAGRWELWQHYYAQGFLLSREYGVSRFSMFNEPNGWEGLTEADWILRLRICSDALQLAVADMNARYDRSLKVEIFAPNTANGAEKYNSPGDEDGTWGRAALNVRHLRLDGSSDPGWWNLHVYNYQKYTTRPWATGGFSGYINDALSLRAAIRADMPGEPELPLALTEFNVRTGANYDNTTATQDSPADFAALGANCVALAENGLSRLYLFKFAQTASNSTYGVAKNGTHYVQNAAGSGWNYGGATKCAEVYRLLNKAAAAGGVRLQHSASAGASPTVNGGLWSLPVLEPVSGRRFVFLANRETAAIPLTVDFSAWPVPADVLVFAEEVSARNSGGVVFRTALSAGKLSGVSMPAQSVWLLTLPGGSGETLESEVTADTVLKDGAGAALPGGEAAELLVRSDGTVNGRSAALLRIPLPPGHPDRIQSVLLSLNAAATGSTVPAVPAQVSVYGLTAESGAGEWTENTLTWQGLPALLKQNAPAGNTIAANVLRGQGRTAHILGQLLTDSPQFSARMIDAGDFVREQARAGAGAVSFLLLQEHRWDVSQPALSAGDTQSAGIRIAARGSAAGGARLLLTRADSAWTRWRKSHFAENWAQPELAGAMEDPDADGVPNLLEYALGGSPVSAEAALLPGLERGSGGLSYRLARDPAQEDLRRSLQLSGDPAGPWQDAAVSVGTEPFVAVWQGFTVREQSSGGVFEVTASLLPEAEGRRFLRYKVELLEP